MKNKKILTIIIALLIFASLGSYRVNATGYSYDFWKNVIPCTDGLAYSETYYYGDVLNADGTSDNRVSFDNLVDLTTYDNHIYILDSKKFTTTKITNSIEGTGVSAVYILNSSFQKEEVIDEILITEEVKDILDEYYDFYVPFSQFQKENLTSTELVDFYGNSTFQTINANEFALVDNVLQSTVVLTSDVTDGTAKVVVKVGDQKLSRKEWSINSTKDGKYLVINNPDVLANNATVTVEYAPRTIVGKAPYFPYSKDSSKAAIRLSNASGIAVTEDGLYIADSGNARIVKANKNADGVWEANCVYLTPSDNVFYQVSSGISIKESTGYTIFDPQKVAVDKTGKVFCIAKNVYEGIVEFDSAGSFNRFIGKNEVVANPLKKFWAKIFSEQQLSSIALDLPPEFTNLTIDSSGFLYATSKPDGDAVKAEKMVKMINTSGKDVLKRNGYVTPDGDASYITASPENGVILGPSRLVGITVSDNGNFTVVDNKRGRLFTYDNEGNLLYVTGDQPGGTEATTSSSNIVDPVAIRYFTREIKTLNGEVKEEEILLVLDCKSKSILVFETTEFGKKVNLAISRYQAGIFSDVVNPDGTITNGAEHYWNEVLKMNTNYELAHLGIGKAQYRRGEFKEAMASFKLAHNAEYYSKAYAEYRDDLLSRNFSWIMTAVLMLVVLWITLKYRNYLNKKNEQLATLQALNIEKQNMINANQFVFKRPDEVEEVEEESSEDDNQTAQAQPTKKVITFAVILGAIKVFFKEVIGYPMYILTHPINGFTDFKNEKKGKMWVSISILILYVLMEIIAFKYEGIITNKNNPAKFNSIQIIIYGMLPPLILAVANWSVTTLLDGKGKMNEIFKMICYSLVPVTLIGFINIILSNVLTLDEAQFITILTVLGWVMTGFMAFMGLVVIHEYGMGKTLWSVILTVLATLIIAFIALLIFDLAQQIYGFIVSLYQEISTRYF